MLKTTTKYSNRTIKSRRTTKIYKSLHANSFQKLQKKKLEQKMLNKMSTPKVPKRQSRKQSVEPLTTHETFEINLI